jgi:hypothetical protein
MMRDAVNNKTGSTDQCWRLAIVPSVKTAPYTQSANNSSLAKTTRTSIDDAGIARAHAQDNNTKAAAR